MPFARFGPAAITRRQLRSMGFCIFNNVGVAAAYALEKKGLERVAIIDFDVHHGNGTEDMFSPPQWHKRVLMASFFQHPFYPYSGTANPAPNMINVPLAAGSDGAAAKKAVETQWLPALESFKPQMIFISAGFDAHREDLLGGMALIEADYAWITRELKELAARHSRGAHRFDARGRLQPVGARPQRRGACQGIVRTLSRAGSRRFVVSAHGFGHAHGLGVALALNGHFGDDLHAALNRFERQQFEMSP